MMRKTFVDNTEEPLLVNDNDNKKCKCKCNNRCKFLTCCIVSSGLLISWGIYFIYRIEEDGSSSDIINFLPGLLE